MAAEVDQQMEVDEQAGAVTAKGKKRFEVLSFFYSYFQYYM